MKANLDDEGTWAHIQQKLTGMCEQAMAGMKKDVDQKLSSLAVTRTFGGSGAGQPEVNKRGILDSKVWDGLKMLDTDKVAFKEWTVKLRNKYLQVRT